MIFIILIVLWINCASINGTIKTQVVQTIRNNEYNLTLNHKVMPVTMINHFDKGELTNRIECVQHREILACDNYCDEINKNWKDHESSFDECMG